MGNFQARYAYRIVIYDRRAVIRLVQVGSFFIFSVMCVSGRVCGIWWTIGELHMQCRQTGWFNK